MVMASAVVSSKTVKSYTCMVWTTTTAAKRTHPSGGGPQQGLSRVLVEHQAVLDGEAPGVEEAEPRRGVAHVGHGAVPQDLVDEVEADLAEVGVRGAVQVAAEGVLQRAWGDVALPGDVGHGQVVAGALLDDALREAYDGLGRVACVARRPGVVPDEVVLEGVEQAVG